MPSFGFNPFAKRINVYTTGVEMGDSKRYFSRDVIRIGKERVAIDPVLTPGEPGKAQQTLFESKISEMVSKQMETQFDQKEKLKFISKEKLCFSDEKELSGLKSYIEYQQHFGEKKRRKMLMRYRLSSKEIDQIIECERSDVMENLTETMKRLYAKVEISRLEYEQRHLMEDYSEDTQSHSLSTILDRDIDDFLALQRLHTPQARYHESMLKRKENDGIVISQYPRTDHLKLIELIDDEYVRKNPIIRDDLQKDDLSETNVKREFIDNEENNVNKKMKLNQFSLINNVKKKIQIDTNNRNTVSMYSRGSPTVIIFVQNLPKTVTSEELIMLFSRFSSDCVNTVVRYTLLTGRMKGQAFVSYYTVEEAEQAIIKMHGFVYNGKPLIVSYKRME